MYKPTFVSVATKFLVDILFYLGILTVLAVPFILPRLDKITGYKMLLLVQSRNPHNCYYLFYCLPVLPHPQRCI